MLYGQWGIWDGVDTSSNLRKETGAVVLFIITCRTFLCFSVCCSFYADFGPLNLAMLYRYCCKLNKKLKVRERALCCTHRAAGVT